jgi:hypothetical protein
MRFKVVRIVKCEASSTIPQRSSRASGCRRGCPASCSWQRASCSSDCRACVEKIVARLQSVSREGRDLETFVYEQSAYGLEPAARTRRTTRCNPLRRTCHTLHVQPTKMLTHSCARAGNQKHVDILSASSILKQALGEARRCYKISFRYTRPEPGTQGWPFQTQGRLPNRSIRAIVTPRARKLGDYILRDAMRPGNNCK